MDPQPPITPSPQPQPVYQQPPPPKKSPGIVIGIFLLILGIAVGLIDKTTLLSRIPFLSTTPTPFFTPTPTPDPAADWKTYTNNEFSFKYPATWIVESNKISSPDTSIEMWAFITGDPMYNECMKLIDTKEIQNMTVKNFSGVSTPEMCDPINLNKKERWLVKSQGEGYAPGLQYSYKTNDPVAETVFDQILSTFTFIDQQRSCSYKGKTYAQGESFPDACNSCSCDNGQVACTMMACP